MYSNRVVHMGVKHQRDIISELMIPYREMIRKRKGAKNLLLTISLIRKIGNQTLKAIKYFEMVFI